MPKWIQKAVGKEGSLHKQMGVPEGEKIPKGHMSKVMNAEMGEKVMLGKKNVRVTGLLKKRVALAQTLKKMKK